MMTITSAADANGFPALLKSWRRLSGLSQLDLALRCGSSQRHISFLESGRSNPSRVMVFALSEAMDVPMRDRNALMLAAGFAPSFKERPLADPELESVRSAIDHILEAHEPYPVIVFNWRHDIIAANGAAQKLLLFLFDAAKPEELPDFAGNLLRAMLHPDGLRDHIENWSMTASTLLRRLQAEIRAAGDRDEGAALLAELASYPGVPDSWRQGADMEWRKPMLTVDIKKGNVAFSLFSTLTTLGAPFDVTLQEIRIETFFPADAGAEAFFLAGGA